MRLVTLILGGLLLAATVALGGCDPELCRYDPDCNGGIGGFCVDDYDCIEGICCDTGNCGGGMCTYSCDGDQDCPVEMLCEHHVCFFICSHDGDCAVGMSCEHGNTICEWE